MHNISLRYYAPLTPPRFHASYIGLHALATLIHIRALHRNARCHEHIFFCLLFGRVSPDCLITSCFTPCRLIQRGRARPSNFFGIYFRARRLYTFRAGRISTPGRTPYRYWPSKSQFRRFRYIGQKYGDAASVSKMMHDRQAFGASRPPKRFTTAQAAISFTAGSDRWKMMLSFLFTRIMPYAVARQYIYFYQPGRWLFHIASGTIRRAPAGAHSCRTPNYKYQL